MHLGFDLCAEEQAFLSKRKQVVAKALKQALQLDRDLQEDEVWENRAMERDSLISYPPPNTHSSQQKLGRRQDRVRGPILWCSILFTV